MDSILEWAVPCIGSDITECFEDENKARIYGFVPFIRWWGKVDKGNFRADRARARSTLKEMVAEHEAERSQCGVCCLSWCHAARGRDKDGCALKIDERLVLKMDYDNHNEIYRLPKLGLGLCLRQGGLNADITDY